MLLIRRLKRKIIRKRREILLLLIVLLIFFSMFEITLRTFSCEQHYDFFQDSIQYKHKPDEIHCNKIKEGNIFQARSNSEGFIDDEFKRENFNIFLLGDSFAQCLQADYNNCVHKNLETELKKTNNKVDVLNFGVSGYGTLDELAILEEYKDLYNPKLIILLFLPQNDVTDNERYINYEPKKEINSKAYEFFIQKTRAIISKISTRYNLKYNFHNQEIETYEVYLENYPKEWESKWQTTIKALEEINTSEIPFLIVIATSPEQVYEKDWQRIQDTYPSLKGKTYDLTKPNQIIISFAEQNNIHYIDLLPLFQQNPERLHYPKDGHWNNQGQLLASKTIKDYILNNNLINVEQ